MAKFDVLASRAARLAENHRVRRRRAAPLRIGREARYSAFASGQSASGFARPRQSRRSPATFSVPARRPVPARRRDQRRKRCASLPRSVRRRPADRRACAPTASDNRAVAKDIGMRPGGLHRIDVQQHVARRLRARVRGRFRPWAGSRRSRCSRPSPRRARVPCPRMSWSRNAPRSSTPSLVDRDRADASTRERSPRAERRSRARFHVRWRRRTVS